MKTLVLTGGPCGGKTTIWNRLKGDSDVNAVFVPELATLMHEGKAGFKHIKPVVDSERIAFETIMFEAQQNLENAIYAMSEIKEEAEWMICDRGTVDNLAYTPETLRDTVLDNVELEWSDLIDFYDIVVHFETQAHGDGYSLDNVARYETADQAKEICKEIYSVWKRANPPHHIFLPYHWSLDKKYRVVKDAMVGIYSLAS